MIEIILLLISLVIGSFGNNLISFYKDRSSFDILRSKCSNCKTRLKFINLIPIISFLIQKGKCPYCNKKLSLRYLFVEGSAFILSIIFIINKEYNYANFFLLLVLFLLLLILFIDLSSLIIPNSFLVILLIIAFLNIYFFNDKVDFIISICLSVSLMLTFHIVNYIFNKKYNKIAIGYGDIKLFGVLTLLVGFVQVLFIIWISSIIALFIYVIFKQYFFNRYKSNLIPFGSFISFTTIMLMLFNFDFANYLQELINYV